MFSHPQPPRALPSHKRSSLRGVQQFCVALLALPALVGGVACGEDVLVTLYQKPISTLRDGLPSVDIETKAPHKAQYERSDVTSVPACGVIGEAMLAFVLADALLEKTGGDSMDEVKRNFEGFLNAQKSF